MTTISMSKLTRDHVCQLLYAQEYVTAQAKRNPHSYTLAPDWANKKQDGTLSSRPKPCNWGSREIFEDVVLWIREHGAHEKFWKKDYICFYDRGYKWWTMGEPIETCRLINRTTTGLNVRFVRPKLPA